MGEELEGEIGGDFRDGFIAEDDFLEEACFFAGGGCGAGEGIVDEEIEGAFAVLVGRVLDLLDDFGGEGAVVDREWCETLGFAVFDFSEVVEV